MEVSLSTSLNLAGTFHSNRTNFHRFFFVSTIKAKHYFQNLPQFNLFFSPLNLHCFVCVRLVFANFKKKIIINVNKNKQELIIK